MIETRNDDRIEILLVDDERMVRDGLSAELEKAGYRVRTERDGKRALAAIAESRPDIVLMDVMMPVMDGLSACRTIRQADPTQEIIFLSALDSDADRLRGYGFGADDYISKSESIPVFLARVSSAARRIRRDTVGEFTFGSCAVSPAGMWVRRADGSMSAITDREVAILRYFSQHPGEVFSRDALLTRFWGVDSSCGESAVNQAISVLRSKLMERNSSIETVWGGGYRYRTKR